ncbi:hypothetical protein P4E94_01565 [Pontiellaceae bacterium B12219]|nr:hypothetical protein [Pontiellaceae bacterium B12219]
MKIKTAVWALVALTSISFAETNSTSAVKTERERPWLAAPMLVSNPSFGTGGGVMGMYFFNTEKGSTNNPMSSLSGLALYSDTDSHFLGIFAKTYWKQDTWRVTAGTANPLINNDFNLDGFGDVKFTTKVNILFARVDRRVYGDWFLGMKGQLMAVNYTDPNSAAENYFRLADVENSTSGQLGAILSHDSRDHVRYPTSGNEAELGWSAAPESWGATESYSVTEGFYNQYMSFVEKQVLALRAYGRFTPSGTPYSGQSALGRFGDLRGYTSGKYVAENLVALQAEYRVRVTKRVGGVAFAGVSQLYNGSFKNTNSDTYYPSGGIGFRYMMNLENKMNFRLDYAWGTGDESGFYMSFGEAF